MLFDGKTLETVTEADLQGLVTDALSERKEVEYKASLSLESPNDKAEFLRDLLSFANTQGGYLIYGMQAENGVPTLLDGLDVENPDGLKLKIDHVVRSHTQPRVTGVEPAVVNLENGKSAVVIHVQRSWSAPHMLTLNDDCRFYARATTGRYRLDVDELRNVFVRSASVADRTRNFRLERIAKLLEGDEPVPLLKDNGRAVLHIVPFGAFESGLRLNPAIPSNMELFWPMNVVNVASDIVPRINFDGLLMYALMSIAVDKKSVPYSYVQYFTNGIIEAVDSLIVEKQENGVIHGDTLFGALLNGLGRYLSVQKTLGVEPPFCVMVTLIGVSGSRLFAKSSYSGCLIDRKILQMPEVVVENFDCDCEPATVMRPIFDAIWNAAGFPRSLNYDEQGKWIER